MEEAGHAVMVVVGNDGGGLPFHLVHGVLGGISPVGHAEEGQVVEVVAEGHHLPGVEVVDNLLGGRCFGDPLRIDFEVAVAGVYDVAVAEDAARCAGPAYFGGCGLEAVEPVDDQDKERRPVEQWLGVAVDGYEILVGRILTLTFEIALHVVGQRFVEDVQLVVVDAIDKGHQVALLEQIDVGEGRIVGESVGPDIAFAADVVEHGPVHEHGRNIEVELLQQRDYRCRRAGRSYGESHALVQQVVDNLGRAGRYHGVAVEQSTVQVGDVERLGFHRRAGISVTAG